MCVKYILYNKNWHGASSYLHYEKSDRSKVILMYKNKYTLLQSV